VIPARPYKPRDKAKFEVGVQVVQRWILARLRNRRFFSLAELNQAIRALVDQLNDRPMRGWGTTRRALYEQIDRPALRELPPSSDGLKKPVRVSSLRERSGKKPGGQKGHPGETLCRTETPDAIIDHYPPNCAGCGAPLTEVMATGFVARQVVDLPEPQPLIITEHRAHGCRCAACGSQTRAAFPDWVTAPVQYGKRIGAFVLYLLHGQLLPEKRLATLMADLFGVRLATATIARISQDCAERFRSFADAVRSHVAAAAVTQMDETGFRVSGKTQWLHVACTTLFTFYRISARRGSLLAQVSGIVVHDHWHPYYTLKGVLHALCTTEGAGRDRGRKTGRGGCSGCCAGPAMR
jgi:transposase